MKPIQVFCLLLSLIIVPLACGVSVAADEQLYVTWYEESSSQYVTHGLGWMEGQTDSFSTFAGDPAKRHGEISVWIHGGRIGHTYKLDAEIAGQYYTLISRNPNRDYAPPTVTSTDVPYKEYNKEEEDHTTYDYYYQTILYEMMLLRHDIYGHREVTYIGGTWKQLRASYYSQGPDAIGGFDPVDRISFRITRSPCDKDTPQPPWFDPTQGCHHCPYAAPPPNVGSGNNHSIDVVIGLAGQRTDGLTGALSLYVPNEQSGSFLYSPLALSIPQVEDSELSPGGVVGVIESDSNDIPRKILAPGTLVDVVDLPSGRTGYELRFYHLADVDPDGNTYTIPSEAEAHTVWVFEDINDSDGTELYVTRKPTGSSRATVYKYTHGSAVLDVEDDIVETGWDLEVYDVTPGTGNAFTIVSTLQKSRARDVRQNELLIRQYKKTWEADDTLVESSEADFEIVDGRPVMVASQVGVGSAAEKSVAYSYMETSAGPRVEHKEDSTGHWTHYFSRDSDGHATHWVEQYQNTAYNESTAAADNREFEVDGSGSDLETTTEKLAGVLVSKRWRKLEELSWDTDSSGENNYRKITEATATDASVSDWDDDSNLATVTYLYDAEAPSTGKRKNAPWLVVRPDGQATLTKYFYDTATVNSETVDTEITETYEGVPSTTAPSAYTATITAGTKTVEERTYDGQLVYRKVTDIGSSAVLEERLAVDFDAFGRVTEYKLFNNNALTEKRSYACCGLDWETDAYGVKTEYTYDAIGRLKTRTDYANGTGDQSPVRRAYLYDALNRKTKTLLGPLSSELTEQEQNYNLAGELAWTKDGLARQTTQAETESSGFILHTTTAPDGSTQVEKRYQDGSLYETVRTVNSTTTRGVRYAYAADSSGNRSVTETPLDNGTLVTAAAVVRWTDFAGRPWKTVSPDPDESGTVEEVRYYATPSETAYKLGQLYKITRSGQPDTLFTYDSLGRLSAQGEDINANGTLTASGGTDRLREFAYSFSSGDRVLTTKTWTASSTYLTEVVQTELKPYPYAQAHSQPGRDTANRTQVITVSTATVVDTQTEGALQTITTTKYGRPASVVKKDYPSGDQLTAVTYAYDAYGRLVTQTDARNGATTTTYDAIGRVASVTTPDPDTGSGATGAGLRPQTLTYAYTDLASGSGYGRRETVSRRYSGATGTIVEETVSEYYPTGELRLSYGANTSPGRYVYDFADRLKTLTTWRDFDLSTGAGTGSGDTTTWTYNDAGLLKTKRYPDNKGPDYTYDSAGRLKTREWARIVSSVRVKATYGYDSATGDLTGIDYSDNTWTTDVTYSGHDRLGRPGSVSDGSGTRTLTYTTVYPLAEEYTAGELDGHKITAARYASGRLDYLQTERDAASDYSVLYYWGSGNRLDSVAWWETFDGTADGDFFREFSVTYTYETNSDLVSEIGTTLYDSLLDYLSQPYGSAPLTQARTYDYLNRVTSIAATADDGANSPVTRSLAYTYNDRNQRTRATNQSGSYWNYGYDSDSAARGVGQVSSAVRKVSGGTTAPGFEFGYAYDAMGNRSSATANSQTSTYYQGTGGSGSSGGNALNQYGSRGVPRVLDIAGLADSSATVTVNSQSTQRQGEHWFKQLALSGNSAQWQSVAVSISTGGSSSGSVLLKEHPEVYAYDDDGNLTSDGRWTYTWDAENRLRRMETASSAYTAGAPRKRIDYAYDDRGRRTLKNVYTWNTSTSAFNTTPAAKVGFLYHDWNLLQEVDLSGSGPATLRSYYWGLDLSGTLQGAGGVGGLLAAGLNHTLTSYDSAFYVPDANGNVSDLVWSQGAFGGHYEYDAFGNAFPEGQLAGANPFRFSTKYTETDAAIGGNETGLLYYGYRFYNPSIGRWLSRDPIENKGTPIPPGIARPQLPDPNAFHFTHNDPINKIDLFGLTDSVTISLWKMAAAGDVAGIQALIASGCLSAELQATAAAALAVANRVNHIFTSAHNLGPLLSKFGGDAAKALEAIDKAAQGLLNSAANGRIQNATVMIEGVAVQINGAVVNGVVRVGTAYIP